MSRKTRSRYQYQIPDDWDSETGDWQTVMMCVPSSVDWRAALYGAIAELTYGRRWEATSGTITEAQEIAREILGSIRMDCDAHLKSIADTLAIIAQNQCCGVSGDLGESTVEEPSSQEWDDVGPPPNSWPDWDLARETKCEFAHGSYNVMLQAISEIERHGNLGLGISVTMLSFILAPLRLASAYIANAGTSVSALVTGFHLTQFKEQFELILDDWVCVIYTSQNVREAQNRLLELIENRPLTAPGQAFLRNVINANWLNDIFDLTADQFHVTGWPGQGLVRCNNCPDPTCELEWRGGTGTDEAFATGSLEPNGVARTLTSAPHSNGFHYIHFDVTTECPCGSIEYVFDILSVSISDPDGAGFRIETQVSDCTTLVDITSSGNQGPIPLGPYTGTRFFHAADVPFTISMAISEVS